eukprot:7391607-Prymnesium_polylepis.2
MRRCARAHPVQAGTLRERQELLDAYGASSVALKMAACENDELCRVGLELGIALLEGGNATVQARGARWKPCTCNPSPQRQPHAQSIH